MKITKKFLAGIFAAACVVTFAAMPVNAQDKDTIEKGVFAEDIDLAGKTKDQADAAIKAEVNRRSAAVITLTGIGDLNVPVTVGDLKLSWSNPQIITEAVSLGKSGNVIKRYKDLKALEHYKKIYDIEYTLDKAAVQTILTEQCAVYNVDAKDAVAVREEDGYSITEGVIGYKIDEEASVNQIYDFLTGDWDGNDAVIALTVNEEQPRGSVEELSKMTDVLGTFTTSFTSSGQSRSANVTNGCNLINGRVLYPGDEFSTYNTISPFSEANGYFLAGSYLNGQVVESLGGGICQVSTTLYNAVLLSELEVTERHNHSMIINYVDPSADAAISESAGKDFRFVNNTDYPIYIEGYTQEKHITFNIYGVETRDPGHSVSYESVVLERSVPETEMVYTDAGMAAGTHGSVQSAHVGYKAELWKIVKENGEQVSREKINGSVYKQSPRSVTIGVSTEDPGVYNALMAAAATMSVDQAVAASQAVAAGQTPEIAPPPAPEGTGDTPDI